MSTMIQPKKNSHGVYTLRKAVPADLKSILGGEIKRSLDTKVLSVAKRCAPAKIAEIESIIQDARRQLIAEQAIAHAEQAITQNDIDAIVENWTISILSQEDLIRDRYTYVEPIDQSRDHSVDNGYLQDQLEEGQRRECHQQPKLLKLMQHEIEEALQLTPLDCPLTDNWRYELAWGLALRRNDLTNNYLNYRRPKALEKKKGLDTLQKKLQDSSAEPSTSTTTSTKPRFSAVFTQYQEQLRRESPDRAANRIIEYTTSVNRFIELHGDLPIDDYENIHIAEFRNIMAQMPLHPNKAIRQLPLEQQILVPSRKISPARVKNILNGLSAIFQSAVVNCIIKENVVRTTPKTRIEPKVPTNRDFTEQEIQRIFSSSAFQTKPTTTDDAMLYWVPIILYYIGARVEEICQLQREDIVLDPLPCIHIRSGEGRSLKNAQSARMVPIHSHIIELGFLEFVAQCTTPQLFPVSRSSRGKLSYLFSRRFSIYIKEVCGITRDGIKPTHSFRHTFATQCRRLRIREDIQYAITGHTQSGVGRNYGSYPPDMMKDDIELIPRLNLKKVI